MSQSANGDEEVSLPGERALTDRELWIAIDLRTQDIAADIERHDMRLDGFGKESLKRHAETKAQIAGVRDELRADLDETKGELLRAIGTLTNEMLAAKQANAQAGVAAVEAVAGVGEAREKLDTLSEQVIEAAVKVEAAKAKDAEHDAQIAKINRALGYGAVVGVIGTALGTLALKVLAAYLGIPVP